MPRYFEAFASSDKEARSFGVPQDDRNPENGALLTTDYLASCRSNPWLIIQSAQRVGQVLTGLSLARRP